MEKSLSELIKEVTEAPGPLRPIRYYKVYYRAAWTEGNERKFCDHQHYSEFYALACAKEHKSDEVVVVDDDVQREMTVQEKAELERGWAWPCWKDEVF